MISIFNLRKKRKSEAQAELAPQLTASQRQAMEFPGAPPAGLPYAAYDQMEQDAMVQTCLTLKKHGVLAAPWRIEADPKDLEGLRRAEFVTQAFDQMEGSPLTILRGAMDAFAKGWSAQETIWEARSGRWWLKAVKPKDPSLFGLSVDAFGNIDSLQLAIPGQSTVTLPRAKFILFAHRKSYGSPKGKSDLDAAYGHWQAKQRLLAAWRLHLERFASPTVLGRFKRGLPPSEQASILTALRDLHLNTAIVFPEEIDVETLGGRESAQGFMEALDFHNREIARAILGQTLTTDEGRRVGSLALGKVHLQVLLLQLESSRRELADVVMTEQVIRPMVELNFGPGPVPRFVFDAPDLSAFSTGAL